MESETEQAAFIVVRRERHESRGEIEERSREQSVIFHNANRAGLFVDKEPAVADRGEVVRRIQAAGDLLQFDSNRAAVDTRQKRSR